MKLTPFVACSFWDSWGALIGHFQTAANASAFVSKAFFPDLDMLPLGWIAPYMAPVRYSKFTKDEARSLMTLMVMARAPLIWGGTASAAKVNATTLALIANAAVLNVSQNSCGNAQLSRTTVYRKPPQHELATEQPEQAALGFVRLPEHHSCGFASVVASKEFCSNAFMSLNHTLPHGAHDNTKCCTGDNLPYGCTYRSDNDIVWNGNKASPLTYEQYGGRAVCRCDTGSSDCSPPGPSPPPPPPPHPPPPPLPADLIVWAAQARAADNKYVALMNVGGEAATGSLNLTDPAIPGKPLSQGKKYTATDLWSGAMAPVVGGSVSAMLGPHASALLLIQPAS